MGHPVWSNLHLREVWGRCCCSSPCSNSACWPGPLHPDSEWVVQGAQGFSVGYTNGCAALCRQWVLWRPCRLHLFHTGSHSSHTGRWCNYTKELQGHMRHSALSTMQYFNIFKTLIFGSASPCNHVHEAGFENIRSTFKTISCMRSTST